MKIATKAALMLVTALAVTLAACGSATESIGTLAAPTTTAAPTNVPVTAETPTTPAPTATAAPTTTTEAPTTTEPPTTEAPTTEAPAIVPELSYTVLRVIDGDTVDIHASDGNEFTVRLIGIDTPEADACEGPLATQTMTSLVNGKAVTLTAGGDGEDIDKYGRFLRYVDTDTTDAGLTMINMGLAKARYDSRDGYGRHDREGEYVAADKASKDYSCPPPPTTAPVTVAPAPQADHAEAARSEAGTAADTQPLRSQLLRMRANRF